MTTKNLLYAQSGGVTSVINATACGVIETARRHPDAIGKVLAGRNGIIGALTEELVDTSLEQPEDIALLRSTPGGAFGSCRYKLPAVDSHAREYERLLEVFNAHNIGMFLYNGGGDSLDTAWKIQQFADQRGYPLVVVGVPKTIDNDLMGTDNCPGFGSVAKYVAISMREAGFDVASMCASSTKVFIMEVMGRHTGWIASAAGLIQDELGHPPLTLLLPEVPLQEEAFLSRVQGHIRQHGYALVAVSEGVKDAEGRLLSANSQRDAFGHQQLGGGVAQTISALITRQLQTKCHWAVADYLQRSARHIASAVDVEQAYALGQHAVEYALAGQGGVMPALKRLGKGKDYRWEIEPCSLASVANIERPLPADYIAEDGFGISPQGRAYLEPLVQGEVPPPYENGLPKYVTLKCQQVPPKLESFSVSD